MTDDELQLELEDLYRSSQRQAEWQRQQPRRRVRERKRRQQERAYRRQMWLRSDAFFITVGGLVIVALIAIILLVPSH